MSDNNKQKKKTIKKKPQMSYWQSCQLRAIHQIGGVKVADIIADTKRYPGFVPFSTATMYRHANYPLDGTDVFDKRSQNKGRPPKLTDQDKRLIRRGVTRLREQEGTLSSRRLQSQTVGSRVSNMTLRRALHEFGFGYRRTRKKGVLTRNDLKKRLNFARKLKRLNLGKSFWTSGISFYLDATGFIYKRNPQDQARTPKAREWRLPNEGLKWNCTTKGSKEGKTQIKFLVAISHGHGVVLCQQYTHKLNGARFGAMVRKHFPLAFSLSSNKTAKRLLQDGCPVQNSTKGKRAIERVGGKIFCIPARSPDLNPIENLFHLVGKQLERQALQQDIVEESQEEFTERVRKTLTEFPSSQIDKIIESMDKRVEQIIKRKGQRLKY